LTSTQAKGVPGQTGYCTSEELSAATVTAAVRAAPVAAAAVEAEKTALCSDSAVVRIRNNRNHTRAARTKHQHTHTNTTHQLSSIFCPIPSCFCLACNNHTLCLAGVPHHSAHSRHEAWPRPTTAGGVEMTQRPRRRCNSDCDTSRDLCVVALVICYRTSSVITVTAMRVRTLTQTTTKKKKKHSHDFFSTTYCGLLKTLLGCEIGRKGQRVP
jgi:hypothetical protein